MHRACQRRDQAGPRQLIEGRTVSLCEHVIPLKSVGIPDTFLDTCRSLRLSNSITRCRITNCCVKSHNAGLSCRIDGSHRRIREEKRRQVIDLKHCSELSTVLPACLASLVRDEIARMSLVTMTRAANCCRSTLAHLFRRYHLHQSNNLDGQ